MKQFVFFLWFAILALPAVAAPVCAPEHIQLRLTEVKANAVELRWFTSSKPNTFRVERVDNDGTSNWKAIAMMTGDAKSFLDITLSPESGYAYRVLAFDKRGVLLQMSEEITAYTLSDGSCDDE